MGYLLSNLSTGVPPTTPVRTMIFHPVNERAYPTIPADVDDENSAYWTQPTAGTPAWFDTPVVGGSIVTTRKRNHNMVAAARKLVSVTL